MTQRRSYTTPHIGLSPSAANRHRRRLRLRPAFAAAAVEPLESRQLLAVDLISVAQGGNAGNEVSGSASTSADGRFVVFASRASNLADGIVDNNELLDVFLRDRATGITRLVSRSVDGDRTGDASSGGDGSVPSVSADGRYVAFQSKARDLVENADDAFDTQDVFVRDMQTGVTTMVSLDGNGNDVGGERPVISADGRFVAFHSGSLLLVPDIPRTSSGSQVFVKNLVTGGFSLASVNPAVNAAGNGPSAFASISGDGRYVAFASEATNLVAEDGVATVDVFVRDMQSATTTLVSVNRAGTAAGDAGSQAPAISADGRFVAFESAATDLVADHSGSRIDVFLRNLAAKTTTLVSANPQGDEPATGESRRPAISPDGRLVAFSSTATGLTAAASDVDQYVRDTVESLTYPVQLNPTGSADDVSGTVSVAANGRVAVGALGAAVAADKNTVADVYLVDVLPATLDLTGPTSTIAATQPPRTNASKTFDFDVAYADATGVKVDTIGDGDVQVTLPDGSTQVAKFVKVTGAGTSVTATYRLTAPGDSLGPEDNGTYAVALLSGAVSDTVGNAALPAAVGTFPVTLSGGTPGAAVDLVPTVTFAAPPSLAAGTGTGKVIVRVANNGAGAFSDTVRINLFASTDATLDSGDASLLLFDKKLKIKGNGFKNVKATVVFPSALPENAYFLLASLDEQNGVAEENDFNNVASASNSVVIAEPFVDITGSFPKSPPLNVGRGKTLPLSLLLQNVGNIPTGGQVVISVVLSANGVLETTDPVLGTITKAVKLKAGASKAIKLKLKIPANLVHGTYRIITTMDAQGTINETNTGNNTVFTNAFQVS